MESFVRFRAPACVCDEFINKLLVSSFLLPQPKVIVYLNHMHTINLDSQRDNCMQRVFRWASKIRTCCKCAMNYNDDNDKLWKTTQYDVLLSFIHYCCAACALRGCIIDRTVFPCLTVQRYCILAKVRLVFLVPFGNIELRAMESYFLLNWLFTVCK